MFTEIQYKFTDWERHSLQNKSLDQQRKKAQQERYYFLLNEKIIVTDINGYILRFKKKIFTQLNTETRIKTPCTVRSL